MNKTTFFIAAALLLFSCTGEIINPGGNTPGGDVPEDKPVTVSVTGITLDKTTLTLTEGETATLIATVTPSNATNKAVSWSSGNKAVATVDNNGKVIGIMVGTATITVTTEDGGKTATCVITVEANMAPSVTIGTESVSVFSAILKGKANLGVSVSSDLKIGFLYSKFQGVLPSLSTVVEADAADADYFYTAKITELEPETTYYYRSFVRQNGQDTYGETKEFKTKGISSVIRTREATEVTSVAVRLNADFDNTEVQSREKSFGFYWGADAGSMSIRVTGKESNGKIWAELSSLIPSRQYFYQTYIVLDGKEYKESVMSFTTSDIETLPEPPDEAVTSLLESVQSVIVVPDYSDGSVKMTASKSNPVRFEIYPLATAQKLAASKELSFSLDCVVTETKSSIFHNIAITEVSYSDNLVKISIDVSSLPETVRTGQLSVSARLRISYGGITCGSDYFRLSFD